MRNFDIKPGFHQAVFDGLRFKFANMSEQDRLCSLVFDEMAIKQKLIYNARSDHVEGFDTVASTNTAATHVGVFIVKGLKNACKQPIGYQFTSGTISAVDLMSMLLECVNKLQQVGLIVLVCGHAMNSVRFMQSQLCLLLG